MTDMIRGAVVIVVAGVLVGWVHSILQPVDLRFGAPRTSGSPAESRPEVRDGNATPATPTSHATNPPQPAAQSADLPRATRGDGFIGILEAKQHLDAGTAFFVDARLEKDYAAGHIPGAFSCPPEKFYAGAVPDIVNMLPRTSAIVVYCGGGDCDASILVAKRLAEFGFASVLVCEQGYTGWTAAGLSSERSP